MDIVALAREIDQSLESVPVLDVHTHLDATHLCARGLHDVLLYPAARIERSVTELWRRSRAGRPERDIYASYIMEQFFTRLEARAPRVMFQFSLGAEPLPAETASPLSQATLASLAEKVAHGQYDLPTALAVAREIFFEAPRRLMGVQPG